jgi:hypothetical protein
LRWEKDLVALGEGFRGVRQTPSSSHHQAIARLFTASLLQLAAAKNDAAGRCAALHSMWFLPLLTRTIGEYEKLITAVCDTSNSEDGALNLGLMPDRWRYRSPAHWGNVLPMWLLKLKEGIEFILGGWQDAIKMRTLPLWAFFGHVSVFASLSFWCSESYGIPHGEFVGVLALDHVDRSSDLRCISITGLTAAQWCWDGSKRCITSPPRRVEQSSLLPAVPFIPSTMMSSSAPSRYVGVPMAANQNAGLREEVAVPMMVYCCSDATDGAEWLLRGVSYVY